MYKTGKVLFLKTETSVHPGAGSEVGIVDLPIQREAHTDFPIIRGSSLKGALRDYFYNEKNNKLDYDKIDKIKEMIAENQEAELLKIVFGPEQNESNDFSSAISFTDSRILFFPVKSLKKIFAYITCPMVLKRFYEDLKKIGEKNLSDFDNFLKELESLFSNEVEAITFSDELMEDDYIVLEEYSFKAINICKNESNSNKNFKKVYEKIFGKIFKEDDFRNEKIQKHLVILSDDDFKDFVLHSTEVVPRIQIDKETGTVGKKGNLWYEENIPTDAVFYSLVLFSDAKQKIKGSSGDVLLDAQKLLSIFDSNLPPIFQLGGNETVGRGLISTKIYPENQ